MQFRIVFLALWLSPFLVAQSYTISTFAGGGLPSLPAPALNISMESTTGAAVDAAGNLYVAEPTSNIIFRISTNGTATLFAGTGRPGFSGDGGPAASAQLNAPAGLALDAHGNLFIADSANFRIREVSTAGIITTVAGNGYDGLSDGVPATSASLNYPAGLAVDAQGNLFIGDADLGRVQKVDSSGILTTIAGNGNLGYSGDGGPAIDASFGGAAGLAVDSTGILYIADPFNSVVRKVSIDGVISTFAGTGIYGNTGDGGPATSAEMGAVSGVELDAGGDVLIVDPWNGVIRKVSPGGIITTVAGGGYYPGPGNGGRATSAYLDAPNQVACAPNGSLYITGTAQVRVVSASGIITAFAGNGSFNFGGDNQPASQALLAYPIGVAVKSDGTVYIADSENSRIREVSVDGVIHTIAGTGTAGYSGDNGLAENAEISHPYGLTLDSRGNIYFADNYNEVIRKISTSGLITTVAGNGAYAYYGDGGPATRGALANPTGVVLDGSGNLYIADTANNVIRKVAVDGIITTIAGNGTAGYSGDNGPALGAQLNSPWFLALDGGGNIYVTDLGNNVVRKISSSGIITTVAGNGTVADTGDNGPAVAAGIYGPGGIGLDFSGNLYIDDTFSVRKVSPNGIITKIAGSESFDSGYTGDNGPATSATLDGAYGIAVGVNGVIYIADSQNNVIRALNTCIESLAGAANADAQQQTLNLPITAVPSCQWSATGLPSWITNVPAGIASGGLPLAFSPNTTGVDRSAVITVNGLAISVTQDYTAQAFQDVTPGAYYFDAVNLLKGKAITSGCSLTEYCPGNNVTRAQMAVFIVRAILGGDNFDYSATPYFTDVQPADFGFKWVQKMFELGITAGCGPGLYCPNDSITRAQMAVFIIRTRYGAHTVIDYTPAPYFTDVPASGFAFNDIQRMREDNITSGCSATDYCPNNPVTRGDMAIFIMRGAFDQVLPPTQPVILSLSPNTIANGTTETITVVGQNTNFVPGTTVVNAVPGLIINSVAVLNGSTLQVSVTANTATSLQPLSIWVTDPTEEAVLPNGFTVQ